MARMQMGGLAVLAGAGVAVWWFLGRGRGGGGLPVIAAEQLAGAGVQSASPDTLAGLKSMQTVPADAVDVFLVPGLSTMHAVAGSPGVYAIPAELVAGGASGMPTVLSGPTAGFGRDMTVMRTTPSIDRPRPGTLTMMSTPMMPAPRALSGGTQFGQPVAWKEGQLYQGGTHETSSGVTGLWY